MISRNLSRRLERLEDHFMPPTIERVQVLTIHFVSPLQSQSADGSAASEPEWRVVDSVEIRLPVPRSRKPKRW